MHTLRFKGNVTIAPGDPREKSNIQNVSTVGLLLSENYFFLRNIFWH